MVTASRDRTTKTLTVVVEPKILQEFKNVAFLDPYPHVGLSAVNLRVDIIVKTGEPETIALTIIEAPNNSGTLVRSAQLNLTFGVIDLIPSGAREQSNIQGNID